MTATLIGRTIVVTRAARQAGPFAQELRSLGATVVEVPLIEIVDPADGGAALRNAVARISSYDWVVLTSPNAAARLIAAANSLPRVAVVGPGTAAVLTDAGFSVDLVADRHVGEGLVAAFPEGPGRVLLPRAAVSRKVIPRGLAAKGWMVDEVEAYRTIAVAADPSVRPLVRSAHAAVFTSSSTAKSFLASFGPDEMPETVVSIGPETTATLEAAGIHVSATAEPHTLAALTAVVVTLLGSG